MTNDQGLRTFPYCQLPTPDCLLLMEFRLQLLDHSLPESLFYELTGLTTFAADKAFRLDAQLSVGSNDDFDGLQAAPPT